VCGLATLAELPASRAQSAPSPLIVLGSLNLDLVAQTPTLPVPGETILGDSYHEYPGGKGLNQAVAAARAGAHVCLVGCVGVDAAGELLRRVLRDESIDSRHLRSVEDHPTGRAMIWVDAKAENSIVVLPGANRAVAISEELVTELSTATTVLAQLEVPIAAVAQLFVLARRHGALTILNPAPAAELSEELLMQCDVLVPNQGELLALGGRQRLHDCGVKVVIETRGAMGAACSLAGSDGPTTTWTVPAPRVSAVDTTGAGDVFCGYLAAALDHNQRLGADPLTPAALTKATEVAAAAAAIAVTRKGAVPSVPLRHEVDTMITALRDSQQ
jgi:ribokinase